MKLAKSPLAPASMPTLPPVAGVRLAARPCGIRYRGRTDLMLAELARGTAVAGVFTRSLTAAAPVEWCRKALAGGKARALVVNSGNANAFTGGLGDASVGRIAGAAAKLLRCRKDEVFLASTGVIGEPLPDGRITAAVMDVESVLHHSTRRAQRPPSPSLHQAESDRKDCRRTHKSRQTGRHRLVLDTAHGIVRHGGCVPHGGLLVADGPYLPAVTPRENGIRGGNSRAEVATAAFRTV